MAAGTSAPTPPSPAPDAARPRSGKFVEYDRYIESQLRRTRRQVKGIDLAASLMLLAAGSMVYLLLAALADHWLVPGGMGFGGRLACLSLFVAGVLAYVAGRLGPLVTILDRMVWHIGRLRNEARAPLLWLPKRG